MEIARSLALQIVFSRLMVTNDHILISTQNKQHMTSMHMWKL